ncbi:MAG: PD-(D/E)XK nuclease family protein [Bacteroidota bacterium]|nr:PD-(D/E)XK nuclease family protein [Bacteroidota bacterium]
MDTFIDRVIHEVQEKHGNDLRGVCVIFPTRRACLIFRNRFAARLEQPVWSPGILGIGDFVSKHATHPVSEEIPLLLTLFEVYKTHWPEQGFDRFYAWGQMLMNDFDEIDKQLSDPSRIFTNISELKKIDAAFLPDPSSLYWIQEFIASMNEKKLTKIQELFAGTWNRLRQIYEEYNIILNAKGYTYEGKAYRSIIKKLKDGTFTSPWKNFIFAGFYGFSRIEEELIQKLIEKQGVTVLWDSDPYYINNKNHEAGYYFRKSPLFQPDPNKTISHFDTGVKNIEITGIPLVAGQAKYTGELLFRLQAAGKLDPNSTAIILADENMLFPVLYSIPPTIETINVTMGYPLLQSQYLELIRILHDLHKHPGNNKNNFTTFHHRYIKRVFSHPLFRGKITKPDTKTDMHTIYAGAIEIAREYGFENAETVFSKISGAGEVFSYLQKVLHYLRDDLISKSGHAVHFEDKVIEYITNELKLLAGHLQDHLNVISTETAWQMAAECVAGLKVPFSGEPVQGLQIMGFLETRALDFKTVILLNVNEGILPATASNKSFIPFSLRKGYGLSTYQDQDASYSYHFYRLLHRAENCYLIYNSEVSKSNGGEPSRFLLQIQQELSKVMGNRLNISTGFVKTPIIPEVIQPIVIKKDADIMQRLSQFLPDKEGIMQRKFSSSAISTYISCSLKFYFRYVAGLKEKEVASVSMEDNTFGTILHRALELLYDSQPGVIDAGKIDLLISKVDDAVQTALKEIYKMSSSQLEGADILSIEVIRELVKRILISDKSDVPFQITGLEEKLTGIFQVENYNVSLYGSIDRMDESGGITRIIDYKTGQVDLRSASLEELVIDPAKKSLFQLYFYALLFRLNFPGKPVKTGFYIARNLGSGISWPGDGSVIAEDKLNEFRNHLAGKIAEILNPEIYFAQTTDENQCKYCPYKTICNK